MPESDERAEQPDLLTVDQVAKRLQVAPGTVRALVKRGELRSVRVGRLLRIPATAVDRYVRGDKVSE